MWCCYHGNHNNSAKKALGGNGGILWQMPTAVKYICVRDTVFFFLTSENSVCFQRFQVILCLIFSPSLFLSLLFSPSFPPILSSPVSLSAPSLLFTVGKLRIVAAVTFDLCSIFHIENNWNSVLEQSGKPRQEEEEGEGGWMRRTNKEEDHVVALLSVMSHFPFSCRRSPSNYI